MLFNSYIFILFFLPICLSGYFIFNHFQKKVLAQIFLLAMSLWFYGFFNVSYLAIILISILFNFGIYKCLYMFNLGIKKYVLLFAIVINIALLFYFKYYNFFLENVNAIFHSNFIINRVVLPLGISFFTFQQLSFIVDAYRGETIRYKFLDYATYVTFFPQLIAGPIVTHDELILQFMDESKKNFQWENFSKGIYLFSLGLAQKVLFADVFGQAVDWGFENILSLDCLNAILVMFSFTMQIYFDFSGYCDMAIGIGKMFNIDLPINFNSPYKALTIREFWERWHITLTRFFTRYVYIPLGGNQKGEWKTYLNMMIIFLLSGFWHGANWTFVLWGGLHGFLSVVTRRYKAFFRKLHPVLNWCFTFSFINISWVLFRANSIGDALRLLKRIVLLNIQDINEHIANNFYLTEFRFVVENVPVFHNLAARVPQFFLSKFFLVLFLMIAFITILGFPNNYQRMCKFKPTLGRLLVTSFLLVWSIFSLSGVSTFLYFNF